MKKKAEELKKGDKITLAGQEASIESTEISDIGKQGTKKCRLEVKLKNGEKSVVIRPADYPFTVL